MWVRQAEIESRVVPGVTTAEGQQIRGVVNPTIMAGMHSGLLELT